MTVPAPVELYTEVPQELKNMPNWGLFKLEWNEDRNKFNKTPFSANGFGAKSNDNATWCSFDKAYKVLQDNPDIYSGLALFFEPPYTVIDIDHVVNEGENLLDDTTVMDFITRTKGSYIEKSVSTTGVHIIVKTNYKIVGNRKNNIEMYQKGRFIALTGEVINGMNEVKNVDENVFASLHDKYIGKKEPSTKIKAQTGVTRNTSLLSNDDVIDKASKYNVGFTQLWNGNISNYTSHSEADIALTNILAYWTGKDSTAMNELFMRSGLMRNKWNEIHGQTTYGQMTINNSINFVQEVYSPRKVPKFKLFVGTDGKTKAKFYSYDDTGNRDRFMDMYGDLFLYDSEGKKVYFYDGISWKPDVSMQLANHFEDVINNLKNEPVFIPEDGDDKEVKKARGKFVKRTRNHAGKVAAMEEIKAKVATDANKFDSKANLLNVKNGTVDLKDFKILPHKATDLLSKVTNASVDVSTDTPMWDKFLNQTFLGDVDMIKFVQRAVGYSILGKNNNRSMFILHGTGEGDGNGSNGKSVFVQTLANVLGDYGTKMSPDSFTAKKFDKSGADASPDMMRLDKARFVYTSELKQESKLNEALIKDITGGEDIVARALYGDIKQFKPTGVVWLTTNYKPVIEGTDGAIWERLKFIPFEAYIPVEEQDHDLVDKLSSQECDGIMNWIIEGAKEYMKQGLNIPDNITNNNEAYRKELDVVQMFIDDNIEDAPGRHTFISDIKYRYVEWKEKANVTMSVRDFSKKFKEHYKDKNYTYNGKTAYHDLQLME